MKKRDHRKPNKYKSLKRKIHLSKDEVWSWEMRGDVILIRSSDHRITHKTTPWKLLGLEDVVFDPIDLERGWNFQITPKDIIEEIAKIKDGSTTCSI